MSDDDFDSAMGDFQARIAEVARLQEECAQLTSTRSAERRRVRVTVNADGIVIDVKFSSDIGDLGYDEIAAAVTKASRAAVRDIADRRREVMATLAVERSAGPMDGVAPALDSLRDQLR
ncbi:YbaB/EbfC family nucleoid-associated protein [Nocardia sp. NPDC005366]|uniref:YbaB/EbfC family nucleoid-associated protein n=1 Tax=Nocardia sp. NPDC005366 TaxID=3156878 RepID=UPI0033A16CDB